MTLKELDPLNGLVGLTTGIVAAYVKNHFVPAGELAALIAEVSDALGRTTTEGKAAAATVPVVQKPAVSIRKSVTEDFIICLEDGQKFKSLKRHISTKYNLTPEQYRAKWGLPDDYPMVAASYAAQRAALARAIGLGQKKPK